MVRTTMPAAMMKTNLAPVFQWSATAPPEKRKGAAPNTE